MKRLFEARIQCSGFYEDCDERSRFFKSYKLQQGTSKELEIFGIN